MKESRRLKRMERNNKKHSVSLNLIPMLDVLSVLVFFLLFHSFNGDMPEQRLALPQSVVETKPIETVVINVGKDEVLVQGEPVVLIADLLATDGGDIVPIMERLAELQNRVIGVRTQAIAESMAITILADKSIPFSVVKQIMSTCTAQGYSRISLAVIQKESAVASAVALAGTEI